jgi:phage shock protein A
MSDTPLTDAAKEGGESWMELAALSAVLERENAALRREIEWRTKRMEILSDGLQGVSDVLKKTINKIAEDALQSDENKLIDAAIEKEAQP